MSTTETIFILSISILFVATIFFALVGMAMDDREHARKLRELDNDNR